MKFCLFLAAGSTAALVAVEAAAAVSITNRDDRDHKITIIEGDSKKEHNLKPSGVLDNVCDKGCIVRLNDDETDEYELEGAEVVSIEGGVLFYDGPDAPVESAPGQPGQESPPKDGAPKK